MQRVPLIHVDRLVEVLKQVSNPFDDSIDPNVLFQRVSSCQIIVPVIGGSPNEAAPHISISVNRQKGDLKMQIGGGNALDQHQLIGMFEAFSHELRQDLRRAFCSICMKDFPFASRPTVKQRPDYKTFRESTGKVSIKVPSAD